MGNDANLVASAGAGNPPKHGQGEGSVVAQQWAENLPGIPSSQQQQWYQPIGIILRGVAREWVLDRRPPPN